MSFGWETLTTPEIWQMNRIRIRMSIFAVNNFNKLKLKFQTLTSCLYYKYDTNVS